MRTTVVLTVLLAHTLPSLALACSPVFDNRSFQEKLANHHNLFVGKVVAATPPKDSQTEGSVTFDIIASQGSTLKVHTKKTLPYKSYGTCGMFEFVEDDVWLYDTGAPFSQTIKLVPADTRFGKETNIDEIIKRVGQRLDPVDPTRKNNQIIR
jgi:hypothetical protein